VKHAGRPCPEIVHDLQNISFRLYTLERLILAFLHDPSEQIEREVLAMNKDLPQLLASYRMVHEQLRCSVPAAVPS
jgi:hypothetical protein